MGGAGRQSGRVVLLPLILLPLVLIQVEGSVLPLADPENGSGASGDEALLNHLEGLEEPGVKRGYDAMSGLTFGKRNFDEFYKSGFGSFAKRNFDEIDRAGFNRFIKRNFDELDRAGLRGFHKRNFDELDRSGLRGFHKRNFDELDRSGL